MQFQPLHSGIRGLVRAGACAGLLLAVAACNRPAGEAAGAPPTEKAATLRVSRGDGRLSSGQEIRIAEWYTGAAGNGYFANFRGSDGGSTVDLRLSGLNRAGTFACGDPARPVSMEIRVDVDNAYRSAGPSSNCEVTVTRVDDGVMEGRYAATLRDAGDSGPGITVSGDFRATRPSQIAEASAPVLGGFR